MTYSYILRYTGLKSHDDENENSDPSKKADVDRANNTDNRDIILNNVNDDSGDELIHQ